MEGVRTGLGLLAPQHLCFQPIKKKHTRLCSGIAQDGIWLVSSLWEETAGMCFLWFLFVCQFSQRSPGRTLGSNYAHVDFWKSQDLSPLHRVASDMTRIHITSSTRVKGGAGWRTCVPAEFKGGKQTRTSVIEAKMSNKNKSTILSGAEKGKTQAAICLAAAVLSGSGSSRPKGPAFQKLPSPEEWAVK